MTEGEEQQGELSGRAFCALMHLWECREKEGEDSIVLTRYATAILREAGSQFAGTKAHAAVHELAQGAYVKVQNSQRGCRGFTHVSWLPRGIEAAIRAERVIFLVDWDNHAIGAVKMGADMRDVNVHLFGTFIAVAKQYQNLRMVILTTEGYTARNPVLGAMLDHYEKYGVQHRVLPPRRNEADKVMKKFAEAYLGDGAGRFILASGDGFFISFVQRALAQGRRVTLVPFGFKNTHRNYRGIPDLQITYLAQRFFARIKESRGQGDNQMKGGASTNA